MQKTLKIFALLVALSLGLVACGPKSIPDTTYRVESATRFGKSVQTLAPVADLSQAEARQLITLPGGDFPDVKWETHNTGCAVFRMDEASPPLPVSVIDLSDGALIKSEVQISISCPPGKEVYWDRTVPLNVPTPKPAPVPTDTPAP